MIELRDIVKTYKTGAVAYTALNGVSLKIHDGEFTAIMGPSGSGKSTLMHVIGFLDSPDKGSYLMNGTETFDFTDEKYSWYRKNHMGFVFQQFHLLSRYDSLSNVQLPLIYTGKQEGDKEGSRLLKLVGLENKERNLPGELSGGERQRVAIARSLINNPKIILADEPTGNLDSKSGKEVMQIFQDLNKQGKTVILVTHDPEIAKYADRVITIKDGKILSDVSNKNEDAHNNEKKLESYKEEHSIKGSGIWEYAKQALKTLLGNKLRSFLSMLGVLIGVAAVISMLAITEGAKATINESLSSLGSNLLMIRPGRHHRGGVSSSRTARFTEKDTAIIKSLQGIKRVSSYVNGNAQAVNGNKNLQIGVMGTDSSYADMRAYVVERGSFFTDADVIKREKTAVIGYTVANELYAGQNPVGQTIKINKINFTVAGVLKEKGSTMSFGRSDDESVIIPVSTAMYRLLGEKYVSSIYAEIESKEQMDSAEQLIISVLNKRHKISSDNEDAFDIRNMAEMQETIASTNNTMTVLLASIAAISLLVGGIGIMNIMLVSVKERTREIGLRKSLGATKKDIMTQFIIEAVIMTFAGGIAGIIMGTGIALIISMFSGWRILISPLSVILATSFSVVIGLAFGIWPAKQASELNPIDALRYE